MNKKSKKINIILFVIYLFNLYFFKKRKKAQNVNILYDFSLSIEVLCKKNT